MYLSRMTCGISSIIWELKTNLTGIIFSQYSGLARKAAVNQVLAGGATPHFIKEFLGHENLNTQNHYTDAAAELQKRQMAIQLTRFENVGRPDLSGPSKPDA